MHDGESRLSPGFLQAAIEKIQTIVQELAEYYGDTVLPIRKLQPDGIHPSWAGYKDLVEQTK